MSDNNKKFNVDELLSNLFPPERLNSLFEKRITELQINPTNALEILDIEYRALQGILNGTNKKVDYTNFIKIASFLQIPKEKVLELYFNELQKNFPSSSPYPQDKINFLNANFDLAILKKAGIIKSIHDYREIENIINRYLGLNNIFDYKLPSNEMAYSEGKGIIQPKTILNRGFWINYAKEAFKEINNPNIYNKESLINYFSEIRYHSTDIEQGLKVVINDLYELGVTVYYQDSLPTLRLKGATIAIDNKPCIVITNYAGFYSTLWHTLCHELSHVLFDFDEIKGNEYQYHISEDITENNDDTTQTLVIPKKLVTTDKEVAADDFAREYLFSKEKLLKAAPHLTNKNFIHNYAAQNHVHPSFIYTYYAYDVGKENPKAWAIAKRNNPNFDELIKQLENSWDNEFHKLAKDHVDYLKNEIKLYR